jgi:hypothetical protein
VSPISKIGNDESRFTFHSGGAFGIFASSARALGLILLSEIIDAAAAPVGVSASFTGRDPVDSGGVPVKLPEGTTKPLGFGPVGKPGGLQLRLRDFATEALAGAELQLRDPIILSTNKLYSLLEQAEDAASVVEQRTGIVTTNKPWVRKRRRESCR